jgi:hypothetical protein
MVAALLLLITIVAVVAVQLITLFGGGQQVQRATDSGNLTAARTALVNITVPLPSTGDELQFNGVSDKVLGSSQGVINLRNINRVMGEAMLVNFNAYVINQAGLDQGATAHAAQTYTAANNIGVDLLNKLKTSPQMQAYFSSTSNKQPTTQYGANNLSPSGNPTFSYLNRQTASNVFIAPQQLADYNFATNTSALYNNRVAPAVTSVSSDPNHNYLKGYLDGLSPVASNPSFPDVYFMPLKPGDRPHLVPQSEFNQNATASSGPHPFHWAQPVPDSLSIAATDRASDGGYTGGFNAFAVVEPIDPIGFAVQLPHGFIRILNGAASPASGYAAGNNDAFVFVMNDNQAYVTGPGGAPLPYFIGVNDTPLPYGASSYSEYIGDIVHDISTGTPPDCSALSVGYTLAGDTLGLGGVSAANCSTITGLGSSVIDNHNLDIAGSTPNNDMASYNHTDSRSLWARPLIEAAYNIPPPQPTGSNNQSVNVADIFNLDMLSARAQGNDFTAGTYQSGIASIPNTRSSLSSPNFIVSNQNGVLLGTDQAAQGGIPTGPAGATMISFIKQRLYQIDPNWTHYTTVNQLLDSNYVPMGGRAYIYYSASGNSGHGGLVLKKESDALTDAPWLNNFYTQACDAKRPVNPTAVSQNPIVNDAQVDLAGDWGFPHPYDDEGHVCVMNWYSFTPSSGYNNVLGEIDLGAVTTNCCADGANHVTSSFSINYGATTDTLNLAPGCACASSCTYSGPC